MATTDVDTDGDLDTPAPPGRWDFLFSWTGLFLVGWVLYELTSQAFLGVTIFCCKLGWEDFRSAIWLRQKDPVSARGKMEFWIFIASGLWRTAISAIVIMMVLALLAARMRMPPPDELEEAGLTATVGFAVSILATMRALMLALWYGRKIWLHPSIHEARGDKRWPPLPIRPSNAGRREPLDMNKAGTLIIFSITSVTFPLAVLGIFFTPFLEPETRIVLFTLFMFFIYPGIVLWTREFQRRRLLAQSPEECWGQDAIVIE